MPSPSRDSHGRIGLLVALLAAYVALAVAYQRSVPIFEAPDESSHVQYLAFATLEWRLPGYRGHPDIPGEGVQPPLYYLLAAPLYALVVTDEARLARDLQLVNVPLYGGEASPALRSSRIRPADPGQRPRLFALDASLEPLRALRWATLPFGVLTVALTWLAALRLSGDGPFALLAGALVAFNPQFVFVSSYVNNDPACAAVGAAALWLVATVLGERGVARRHYLALAALAAVGAATKLSSLPPLAVAGLAVLACDARPLRVRLADAGWALALGLLLTAPLAASNLARFGDPVGLGGAWSSAHAPGSTSTVARYLASVFTSYWAAFGWLNVLAPLPVYAAFFLLCAAGVAGFALRWRSPALTVRRSWILRGHLVGAVCATLAVHVWWNVHVVEAQGRHFFAVAPQIACLLAMGIAGLTTRDCLRVRAVVAGAAAVGLAALALYCGVGVIARAYA